MKQILKKSKVYFLFGLILFFSCTQEKDFVNEKNHRLKMSEKSFDELSRIPSFKSALKKIPKKKPSSDFASDSRSAIEEEFDFFFSRQPAKVIERDDKTSYTFLILREVKDVTYFENLIIEINNDMKARAVINKYTPSEPITTEQVNKLRFEGDINSIKLFDEINPNAGDLVVEFCVDFVVSWCQDAGTINDCFGKTCGISYYSICSQNGGSSGGTSGGTSGGSSSGGNAGGNAGTGTGSTTSPTNSPADNPVVTTIVPPASDPPKIPCKQLNDLLKPNDSIFTNEWQQQDTIKSPKLKQKIVAIAPNVNSIKEVGYELEYSQFKNNYTSTFVPPTPGTVASNQIELSINGNFYGGMHTHPLNSIGVPSFLDLVWLRDCYQKAKRFNLEKVVMIVIVKNPNQTVPATKTYAMKIDDFAKFDAEINLKLSKLNGLTNEDKIKDALKKESDYYGEDRTKDEKLFLKKYATLGASLYEADTNLTKFEKLALQNGNTVVKEPCITSQQ